MNILLAQDGSAVSLRAAAKLVEHLKWFSAPPHIHLLFVHPPIPIEFATQHLSRAALDAYYREVAAHPGDKNIAVRDKTCLCTHMRNFDCWTCGHYTYRLKDTTRRLEDGSYQLLAAEHIFRDYQFSKDGKVALPD